MYKYENQLQSTYYAHDSKMVSEWQTIPTPTLIYKIKKAFFFSLDKRRILVRREEWYKKMGKQEILLKRAKTNKIKGYQWSIAFQYLNISEKGKNKVRIPYSNQKSYKIETQI